MAEEPDLLITAGFSDAQLVAESNKVVAAFKKRGEEAQKAFQDATGRVTNTAAARAHMRELDRLSKAYDPVYRAAARYEAEVKKLDRALDLGAISQADYTARVADAAREMQSATQATSASATAMAASTARAQTSVQALGQGVAVAGGGIGRFRGQVQNAAFQFQDFVVQVQNGTAASVAFSQQAPQLLGGFGAVGAVLGLVAALAVPVGAALFNLIGTSVDLDEQAKLLDTSLSDLNSALGDYRDAVSNAIAPTDDLIEKYGRAAGSAQQLLQQLANLAKLDAASALRASSAAVADSLGGAIEALNKFEAAQSALAPEDFLNEGTAAAAAMQAQVDALRDQFGLTVEQAQRLRGILTDAQTSSTPEAVADAMRRLAVFLAEANLEAGYTNDALLKAERAASEGALAGYEFATALEGAAAAAAGVSDTVATLPGAIDQATASALRLTRALSIAIAAAQSMPGSIDLDLNRFGDGSDITRRAGGMDLQEQLAFRYDWLAKLEEMERSVSAGRAGTSRGGRGASGQAATPRDQFFSGIQDDIVSLEREIGLIGKSNEEVAVARARWAALDEAKRRGIPVNAEMMAQIDAQAAQFGRLTVELERAEAAQQQFDQAINGIANAMSGALLAGESLRDGFANILRRIAADILASGIRQALVAQFASMGGAGFMRFLGPLIGSRDPLTLALQGAGVTAIPSFEGGGSTGPGIRAGGVDGRGGRLAVLHPNETVIDHGRGQAAGSNLVFAPTINLGGSATQEDIARLEAVLEKERRSFAANVLRVSAQSQARQG